MDAEVLGTLIACKAKIGLLSVVFNIKIERVIVRGRKCEVSPINFINWSYNKLRCSANSKGEAKAVSMPYICWSFLQAPPSSHSLGMSSSNAEPAASLTLTTGCLP